MNVVIASGNLTKDARLLTTNSGRQCCVTTLALREDMRPETRPATFIDIIIWGERAPKLASYLNKGQAVSVVGRLEISKSTGKNNTVYVSPRIVVDTLEFLGGRRADGVRPEVRPVAEPSPVVEPAPVPVTEVPEEDVPF